MHQWPSASRVPQRYGGQAQLAGEGARLQAGRLLLRGAGHAGGLPRLVLDNEHPAPASSSSSWSMMPFTHCPCMHPSNGPINAAVVAAANHHQKKYLNPCKHWETHRLARCTSCMDRGVCVKGSSARAHMHVAKDVDLAGHAGLEQLLEARRSLQQPQRPRILPRLHLPNCTARQDCSQQLPCTCLHAVPDKQTRCSIILS